MPVYDLGIGFILFLSLFLSLSPHTPPQSHSNSPNFVPMDIPQDEPGRVRQSISPKALGSEDLLLEL